MRVSRSFPGRADKAAHKGQLFLSGQFFYFSLQTQRRPLIRAGRTGCQPHGAPRPRAPGPSGEFTIVLSHTAFHIGAHPAVQTAVRTKQQIDIPDPIGHILFVCGNELFRKVFYALVPLQT